MVYLIGQLLVPLAIAALAGGGLAGWSWHCIRTRDRWNARDAERDSLRNELLNYVGYTPREVEGPVLAYDADREALETQLAAAREEIAGLRRARMDEEALQRERDARMAQLEMELASVRAAPANDDGAARFGLMESALQEAEAKAAELERRARELEAALDGAPQPEGVDVAAMRWRLRELEARVAAYEAQANAAQIPPPPPPQPAPDVEDALNRERWRARYLQARVRYLEGLHAPHAPAAAAPAPAPAPAPESPTVDPELENRKVWRQRYLEARVAWLEGRIRDAGQHIAGRDAQIAALQSAPPPVDPRTAEMELRIAELEGAVASLHGEAASAGRRAIDLESERAGLLQRIAELESRPPPAPAPDPEAGRLKWRARYLDSRVRYLEQSLAGAARVEPAPAPAPRDRRFAPLAPAGAEVRPQGLPAPRGGARDDLRLIAGVDPRIESTLNSLGVYHFDQIAAWTPQNVDWVERYLAFKGRIGREEWVRQAQALASGEVRTLADEAL